MNRRVKRLWRASTWRAMSAALAGAALLGCIVLAACSGKSDAKIRSAPPVEVKLAPPRIQSAQRTVDVPGTIYGQEEITISAKVSGRIETINKDIGDAVAPGAVLAQIEQTDYRLTKEQKLLAIREALAKLGLTELPREKFDPATVATVQRAKLQADNALARYNRGKSLHDQVPAGISDQDFADLQTAWEVARSNHEVEMLTAQSVLADAFAREVEWHLAEQRLQDTTVRAPAAIAPLPATAPSTAAAGAYYVVARLTSIGEYVKEGAPLFKLVDDNAVKLRANVPERHAARLAIDQVVTLRVAAYEEEFRGRITRINPQVEAANRTFAIEALVPNPQRKLKSGSFARASIQTYTDSNVLFVPRDAVFSFAGESRVFRVKDGKAVQFNVEIGETRGDFIEITKGLEGTEPVVVTGASKLATGVVVKLAGESARPATATK